MRFSHVCVFDFILFAGKADISQQETKAENMQTLHQDPPSIDFSSGYGLPELRIQSGGMSRVPDTPIRSGTFGILLACLLVQLLLWRNHVGQAKAIEILKFGVAGCPAGRIQAGILAMAEEYGVLERVGMTIDRPKVAQDRLEAIKKASLAGGGLRRSLAVGPDGRKPGRPHPGEPGFRSIRDPTPAPPGLIQAEARSRAPARKRWRVTWPQ